MINTLKSQQTAPKSNSSSKNDTTLTPDFSHRLSPLLECCLNSAGLADTLDHAVNRADGVLSLLSHWFTGHAVARLDDEIFCSSLESVALDMSDVIAVVSAFKEATHSENRFDLPHPSISRTALSSIEQTAIRARCTLVL